MVHLDNGGIVCSIVMEPGYSYLRNRITKVKEKLNNKTEVLWEDGRSNDWKSIAEEKQQFYLESLGGRTWEEYQINEVQFLKLKIGFAIFGPSAEADDENIDNPVIHFKDPEQMKTIDLIAESVYKISEPTHVYSAFIFVIAFVNNEYAEYPVIRVLNKKSNSIFFTDMLGRVYRDWNDFTSNNILPSCICCYPKNGFYTCNLDGKVKVNFAYSPENSRLKRFLRKVDTVNGVAGVGSAAVGIAALAVPLSGPLVLGSAAAGLASAVWSTCRTVTVLRDRKKHCQTLSVSDRNARACWLSLAAGIIGGASAGAVHYTELIARTGLALNRIPCLAVNTLEIGNIGIGGLSIINHIANIVEKKECTLSDSIQVILSILFFCHATISFMSAKAIMKDMKDKILNNVEKELNITEQNEFIMKLQEIWKTSLTEANPEIIKSLTIIENEEAFFQQLLGIEKKPKALRDIIIDDDIMACTNNLNLVAKVTRAQLMSSSTARLSENEQKLLQEINIISKEENLMIIEKDISKKMNMKGLSDFCIDGKRLFSKASSHEIYILHKTVEAIENNKKNSNALEKVFVEIKNTVRSVSCKNLHEFILLIQNILQKYEEYKLVYEAIKKIIETIKVIKLKTGIKTTNSEERNHFSLAPGADGNGVSVKEE